MMLPSQIAREQIEILAPGVRTEYGRQVEDWSHPTVKQVVTGCSVQPRESSEVVDGREATIWVYHVWAPENTPVEGVSRVRWRGVQYRVTRGPVLWVGPTSTGLSHVVFDMRASKG